MTNTLLEVRIVALQYTPDRDPVVIQWCAASGSGPFAQIQNFHTTQTALEARSGVAGYWSDAEGKAELANWLTANGIAGTVIDNPDPATATSQQDVQPRQPATFPAS